MLTNALSQCGPSAWSWLEFIKAIGPIGGWGLVILGWHIVRKDNDRRQTRKEERDRIDSAIELIKEMTLVAYEYYGRPGNDERAPMLEQKLMGQFAHLRNQLAILKKIGVEREYEAARMRLWQSITSGDFQVKKRPALQIAHSTYQDIADCAFQLESALEEEYLNRQ